MKTMFKITLISIGIALITTSCEEKKEEITETLRPVRYEMVKEDNGKETRTFSGIAEASDEIDLSFRNGGTVINLNIVAGQRVNKGDLLIELDNVQARLKYEQSVSALNSARSAMNTAKSSLARTKVLYEKGSQSLNEYEYQKDLYQSAVDNYESAQSRVNIDRANISYGYIYAPKSGMIADVDISLNETVNSGQVVAVLNAGEDVNVEVGIPENMINNIQVGMPVEIDFASINSEWSFSGTVIEIAPIVDNRLSTYPVKIDIENQVPEIKPGMVASVSFTYGGASIETEKAGIVIPIKSVGKDGNGNFVFIIEKENENTGVVKKRPIEIGQITANGLEVLSGLSTGELIATAGLQSLLDGQKVKLN